MRFVAVYALTIVAPAILLGWFGISDSLRGEASMRAAVESEIGSSLQAAVSGVEVLFDQFEQNAANRLASGHSVQESPGEISPYLLLAVRLDERGEMVSPRPDTRAGGLPDHLFFLIGDYASARRLEQQGDFAGAALLYQRAAAEAPGVVLQGTARLQWARVLARAGRMREAEALYTETARMMGPRPAVWGLPVAGLARLGEGKVLLQRDPQAGVRVLRAVVESVLASAPSLDEAGELSVALHALDHLETRTDADWLASRRSRLDVRAQQIYWARRLLPEIQPFAAGGRLLRVASGAFRYTVGDVGLWATTWQGDQLYAFALDLAAVLDQVLVAVRQSMRPDGQVAVTVLAPEEPPPPNTFERRSLAPWMPGWSVAAHPVDAEGLVRALSQRRMRRILLVLLSMATVALGATLISRLVSREMDLARLKSAFAANVSHELRSPITQIRLKGESLQLGLAEDEDDRQRHYDTIVREAERLSRLVDNVLDFAAIERGTKNYTLRPADLAYTLRVAVETTRYSMEVRGVDLEADIPPSLPVIPHDPDAIAQALTNLLSNAAKYGAEGHWISVSVTVLPEEVQVHVADRGIGVPPDERERIFDQYYRGKDPRARRSKGTGIGLAIVKYIMDAHGGRVSVAPYPGRGSVFTLHLPVPSKP